MNNEEFLLNHPLGFTVSKKLKEIEISSVFDFQKEDMGNGYIWYDIPAAEISGKRLVIRLCFYNGNLDSLVLSVIDPEQYGNSWDDWSEEKEKLCANHTREWLETNGYTIGKFSWGEVWADYDPRSGSGSGGIRYKP